jgi:flagellar biosynthetic protein FliQ
MTPEVVMTLGEQALIVMVKLAAPLLLAALATGFVIGMLQAATQMSEMTLSFVPKLLVMVMVLFVAGHWMLNVIVGYTRGLVAAIPQLIG